MTGIYTGRSPKDKFIVMDENSKDTVWWTSDEYKNDNHPASEEAWAAVKEIAKKELSNKRLYVVDAMYAPVLRPAPPAICTWAISVLRCLPIWWPKAITAVCCCG